jgi:hypothetical protein
MDKYEWKDILGFDGKYAISSDGRVMNKRTGKLLKHAFNRGKFVRLTYKGVIKSMYVSRLIAEAFIPNPDNKPIVGHLDGNKLNNDITNLCWQGYKENRRMSWELGLHNANHRKVKVISLEDNVEYESIKEYADKMSLNYSTVYDMLRSTNGCNKLKVKRL